MLSEAWLSQQLPQHFLVEGSCFPELAGADGSLCVPTAFSSNIYWITCLPENYLLQKHHS